jgi:hypothetical protein
MIKSIRQKGLALSEKAKNFKVMIDIFLEINLQENNKVISSDSDSPSERVIKK